MTSPQLEQIWIYPRRGQYRASHPAATDSCARSRDEPLPAETSLRRLKKGETFSSPTSPPSEDHDPVLNFPSLPRRSPTCLKTLEEITAGEQQMTDILSRLSLSSPILPSKRSNPQAEEDIVAAADANQTHISRSTVAEKPQFSEGLRAHPVVTPRSSRERAWSGTDSGLGTSIGSSQSVSSDCQNKVIGGQTSGSQRKQSAVTGSISAVSLQNSGRRKISQDACKQINRFVLAPILKEERLKPFHPLVHSIPQRISNREIGCLRDLEKILLWLTPDTVDRKSFVDFWEVTVRCLHTTVSRLNDRDLRLPSDRPYTNGYFLDLVDQLRQYAATISTQADGQSSAKGDVSQSDHLSLEGGLSKTGRPAELVVRKGGEAISLRTGEPHQPNDPPTFKRSLSLNAVDEGVERSMARRKKNAPPMDINKKCTFCTKRFKRPCDLTKHEKTHIRPAKCPEPTCKYSIIGWANEKERDRHVNDKHCKSPKMFKCEHPGCPYESKRESNCKQHMEKAHGYEYSRTKGNSKRAKRESSAHATPQSSNIATPASGTAELPTPSTGLCLSPSQPPSHYSLEPTFSFADPPARTGCGGVYAGVGGYRDSISSNLHDFDSIAFDAFQTQLEAADSSALIPTLDINRRSFESPVPDLIGHSLDVDHSPVMSAEGLHIPIGFDWSLVDEQNRPEINGNGPYSTIDEQVLGTPRNIPAQSVSPLSNHQVHGLSPGMAGNVMLYTPDETVSDLYTHAFESKSKGDFPLYGEDDGQELGVTLPSYIPGLNPMFPSIDTTEDYLYMDLCWAGHPALIDGTAYPMDLDKEFTG